MSLLNFNVYLYFAMTKKLHNNMEQVNLQSLISSTGDCGFAYAPDWNAYNVKYKEK